MLLFTIEDDDDLAIIVAFGENETIEALIIVILSLTLILSRSLKLFFFFFCVYFFFSLLCFKVCLCGLLIWFSVVFYINPEKKESFTRAKKQTKRSFRGTKILVKIRHTLSFFFQSKKTIFKTQKVVSFLLVVIH